jgi:hypothetical protein
MTDLDTALRNDSAWRSLVEARLAQLRRFLAWAAAFESGDTETSLRFRNRPGLTFEERFAELGRINVTWWARTTRFDVLTRAGQLRVAGETYEPALAHLAGATGPKKGFEKIWGIKITPGNAERCEALLRKWSGCWDEVAGLADVQWPGEAYQPADFENALCVFQERPHSNCRTPPTSVDERIRRSSRRSCSPGSQAAATSRETKG